MKLFLAWMFGWLLMMTLHHLATRHRVVIHPRDASHWQKITSGDLKALRQAQPGPKVTQRRGRLILTDRGC